MLEDLSSGMLLKTPRSSASIATSITNFFYKSVRPGPCWITSILTWHFICNSYISSMKKNIKLCFTNRALVNLASLVEYTVNSVHTNSNFLLCME